MSIRDITNVETGRLFRARIVNPGDPYGLGMRLTNDRLPMLEFYDAAHDHDRAPDGQPLGQFVSRYHIATLLGIGPWSGPNVFEQDEGLDLNGGVDAWKIDRDGMAEVEIFLLEEGCISELSSRIALEKHRKKDDDQPSLT